jgi:hypothetical protein
MQEKQSHNRLLNVLSGFVVAFCAGFTLSYLIYVFAYGGDLVEYAKADGALKVVLSQRMADEKIETAEKLSLLESVIYTRQMDFYRDKIRASGGIRGLDSLFYCKYVRNRKIAEEFDDVMKKFSKKKEGVCK